MTDRQKSPRILYCHCQYAQVIPSKTKTAVLEGLCQSSKAFDAVADLCEMAARQDPALQSLSHEGPVKIAACFPRAIKWLFAGAKAPLDRDNTEVLNMREFSNDWRKRTCNPIYPRTTAHHRHRNPFLKRTPKSHESSGNIDLESRPDGA